MNMPAGMTDNYAIVYILNVWFVPVMFGPERHICMWSGTVISFLKYTLFTVKSQGMNLRSLSVYTSSVTKLIVWCCMCWCRNLQYMWTESDTTLSRGKSMEKAASKNQGNTGPPWAMGGPPLMEAVETMLQRETMSQTTLQLSASTCLRWI